MRSHRAVSLLCLSALILPAACKFTTPDSVQAQEVQAQLAAFDKAVSVPPQEVKGIKIYSMNQPHQRGGTFQNLFEALKRAGRKPAALINGGMVEPDGSAVGLLIVDGAEVHRVNLHAGTGNFYMGKKGAFAITKDNKAEIFEPTAGISYDRFNYATQSGPLLIQNGTIVAGADWRNAKSRSAVGISDDGSVTFVQDSSKGLRELAEDGKRAGFQNMLYLDGGGYDCIARSEREANSGMKYAAIISVE